MTSGITLEREGGLDITALAALFRLTVRQYLHGKRWIMLAVLFLLPAGLAILIRATSPDVPPVAIEFVTAFMFIPQAILPLAALLYATGIIQDEQEEQTITYLLVRPIPKWALYAVKLAATLATVVFLTAVFMALTYVAVYVGKANFSDAMVRCGKAAAIQSLAVVAYCSLFGLISMFTRRTLLAGIVYTVIVEGFLANLPISIRMVTVIYYARVIAYHTLPFTSVTPGGTEDFAATIWQFDVANDPKLLEHPSVAACLVVLLGGSFICAVLAAALCWRKEFYVKTPEKTA